MSRDRHPGWPSKYYMAVYVIGDSHARSLVRSDIDGAHTSGSWVIFGVGGATAHNLINSSSETAARQQILDFLDSNDEDKDIFLLFGDVDCTDHIKEANGVAVSIERYRSFVLELSGRQDVRSVQTCKVYPRTSVFTMNGRDAAQINEVIALWNASLIDPVDTYTPLVGDDGFLHPEMSHSPTDPGERHLSKAGCDMVYNIIKTRFSPP